MSTSERQSLVKPGMFGLTVPADTRRWEFDLSNEALIVQGIRPDMVFIGDSITHFWELQAYFGGERKIIINRGISADTSEYVCKRFYADVLQLKPKLVVIMIGTNDLGWMLEQLDSVNTNKTCENIEIMAGQAQAEDIKVAIGSLLPVRGPSWYPIPEFIERKNAQIVDTNTRLKDVALNIGATYIDYHSMMVDDNGWLRPELAEDGVHPHSTGYAIMAGVLRAALSEKQMEL